MKSLNDKLMLTDILAHLKEIMQQCSLALAHGSCKNGRELVTEICERTADNQFDLFVYMNEHGYYPVKYSQDTEIQQAVTMHKGKGV